MNYLTKKNFGIPVGLLSSIAVLLGYGLYSNTLTLLLATIIFAGVVFLFDFDEVVKATLKKSVMIAIYGRIISICIGVLNTILSWFSNAAYSDSEGIRTTYKVFNKILDVAGDCANFAFLIIFIVLLLAAMKGKVASIKVDLSDGNK